MGNEPDRPPGYHWTFADQIFEFCTACAKQQPTYCEKQDGTEAVVICCCLCQRILKRGEIGPSATARSIAIAENRFCRTYLI